MLKNEQIIEKIHKSLVFLLTKEYLREFEIIDGLKQHPEGLNFNQWLEEKGLK